MRLIDADRLSAVLQKNFGHTGGAAVLQQLIDIAPTVDPVEHGHVVWRERQFTGPKYQQGTCLKCGQEATFILPPMESDEVPYCSACGARLSDDFQDYCPKCGAKLDGEPEQIKAWREEGRT